VSHAGLRRPNKNDTNANTKNTKKRIFATPAALAAMPPKPNTAASSAITKNIAAQYNIVKLLQSRVLGDFVVTAGLVPVALRLIVADYAACSLGALRVQRQKAPFVQSGAENLVTIRHRKANRAPIFPGFQ